MTKVTTREIKAENEAAELSQLVKELERTIAVQHEQIKVLDLAVETIEKKFNESCRALAAERVANAALRGQAEALLNKLRRRADQGIIETLVVTGLAFVMGAVWS